VVVEGRLEAARSCELARPPHAVEIVSELPKTRNAKILRRVVRSIYLGTDPGDLSSLENRGAIEALEQVRAPH